MKNLTPQPPSLQGKGEHEIFLLSSSPDRAGAGGGVKYYPLLLAGEGLGEGLNITPLSLQGRGREGVE
ncbi:MAG TPA: hypothetical protein DEG17_04940 [Cyanobacteria bacterium UBA11149]|nr:hypothetical protein [Cyanobacteria bacterium UBA11367]HBR74116.1 hypothetical protein [Cyanobacteria bacterium UBA11159]HBW88232.1 hypothetical protein [Cyanobacteria bacterium UBA11149]